jgi:hypothetical protein
MGKVLAFGVVSSFSVPSFSRRITLPAPGDDSGSTYALATTRYLEAITRHSIGGKCFLDRLAPFFAFDAAVRSYNSAVYDFHRKYGRVMWLTEEDIGRARRKDTWPEEVEDEDKKEVKDYVGYGAEDGGYGAEDGRYGAEDGKVDEKVARRVDGKMEVPLFEYVDYQQTDWSDLMQWLSNPAFPPSDLSYQDVLNKCYGFICDTFDNSQVAETFFPYDDLYTYACYRDIDSDNCVFPDDLLLQREACKTAVEAIRGKALSAMSLCPDSTHVQRLMEAVVKEEIGADTFVYKVAPGFESIDDKINDLRHTLGTVLQLLAHVYKAS